MNINDFASKTFNKIEDHAPIITITLGVAGLITAGIIACKKVRESKMNDILEKNANEKVFIEAEKASIGQEPVGEGEKMVTKPRYILDKTMHFAKCKLRIAKHLWVPIVITVGSVGSVYFGYFTEHKRLTSAMALAAEFGAAYEALKEAFIDKNGQDAFDEFLGIKKSTIETPVLDKNGDIKTDKNGNIKVTKEDLYIIDDPFKVDSYSPYAFVWGSLNRDGTQNLVWDSSSMDYNWELGKSIEKMFNINVSSNFKGRAMYNEMLEPLDIPITEKTEAGWHRDSKYWNPDIGVDFRMRKVVVSYDGGQTIEDAILFDPNVCGDIREHLKKRNTYSTIH